MLHLTKHAWRALAIVTSLLLVTIVLFPATASAAKPTCFGLKATIVGTNHADKLVGTDKKDVIVGLGGADKIKGGDGNDLIFGAGSRLSEGRPPRGRGRVAPGDVEGRSAAHGRATRPGQQE